MCPAPVTGNNAYFSANVTKHDIWLSSISYNCYRGFRLSAGHTSINISCQDGQWNSNFTDCTGKKFAQLIFLSLLTFTIEEGTRNRMVDLDRFDVIIRCLAYLKMSMISDCYLRRRYLGQQHCLGHSKQVPFTVLKNGQLDLSCST